ncbi:patatin-like protein [Microvirga tunisiensis]|uniref:Patatin-like protein n=1 Tax=Pannonibacter tanglangensis TaxID=2750084 RepID=A0A7X5J8D6_9HYPH|nr:patatin-like protein [Pannonibacter sp. XCT-53]NBN77356.1 patatin-like protein [Pannonibacter sp. XCT-53]
MKQIEIRLALVFYGGVSLAIYMHGVSREILNLVKASSCRGLRDPLAAETDAAGTRLSPSTRAYIALLQAYDPDINVRVVVDAIAGASAGGVNGVMLARAIAHDLPLDAHRGLWLENADVTRLAQPQDGLTRILKSGMSPVLDRMITSGLKAQIDSPETREKLRLLTQSRWFTPPFSGERYIGWMLDACREMDREFRPGATLVPNGQTLELFVTLTDYFGRSQRIRIDEPAYIEEREHRRILKFACHHRTPGVLDSQLSPAHAPGNVFAARATSSFPGAFPPATIGEMDRVLAARGEGWDTRMAFLGGILGGTEEDLLRRSFVDGSVVMNKPFGPVITAIGERPATREVARRLVYVDPVPNGGDRNRLPDGDSVPGFFRVILSSLAHIPRNEPIGDDLRSIEARNRRARRLAEVIADTDPMVEREVGRILPDGRDAPLTIEELTQCRTAANEAAHRQAGYAYLGYQTLKLQALAERIAGLLVALAARGGVLLREDDVLEALRLHLREAARTDGTPSGAGGQGRGSAGPRPERIIAFLKQLDVDYRVRRLRFVVRKLNSFYQSRTHEIAIQKPDDLDALKRELYEQIDRLQSCWSADTYPAPVAEAAAGLAVHGDHIDAELLAGLLDQVSRHMGLLAQDRLQDDVFAVMTYTYLVPALRQELTRAYVGFAFYDLVTLPVFQRSDFSEVNETLVDRISPRDASSLLEDGFVLKGSALNTFGAFFNRSWREHDYLWGRLTAADRLVAIVRSSIQARRLGDAEIRSLRRRLFLAILEEERPFLTADPQLIPAVEALIEARLGGEAGAA